MIRQGLALFVAATLMGCAASAELDPQFGSDRQTTTADRTRFAAEAASTQYPRDAEASDELRVGALVDQRNNRIKLLNFSNQPIRDATVWVNGSFVHKVENIPVNGSVTIPRSHFYDSSGRSLANQATTANQIQIQWNDRLHNVQGPIRE